ncbi:MAG: hypothetical protein WC445_03720 [Patescibacteria group bacterium]
MAKIVKRNKKTVHKHPRRKEVEIPVFVIREKEQIVSPAARKKATLGKDEKGANEFGILKDGDDLPVFQNFSESADEEKNQDEVEVEKEWKYLKDATHKKDTDVLVSEKKSPKKKVLLSESKKRIIMWASVAVFACLIFFIWFSSLENNFANLFGSASFTFSRSEGVLEEVGDSLEEFKEQINSSVETTEAEGGDGEKGLLDQIKEKILVEELKDKVQ